MQEKWWKKSVIYQVYPKSFKDSNDDGNGDLPGLIEKLDYLSLLGIDGIWLSPVYQSPMVDQGYDISDYEKIDPVFGTMVDFECLVNQAKARNIAIIMDLVVNHTSNQHHWFQESRKSRKNSKRDFYIWRDKPTFENKNWTFDKLTQQYYYHSFSSAQPDLNWENQMMRKEIYRMMKFWVDKGVGGFRLDVIDLIGKIPELNLTVNGPKLHDYLQEMNEEVFSQYDLLTVGEAWSSSPALAPLYSAEKRKELSMIFGFWHILTSADNGDKWQVLPLNVPKLKEALEAWQKIPSDETWNALFWGNHDLPRVVSFWGNEMGNREQSAKAFAILLHLMKGTPFIYQGEELGMTNFPFENRSEIKDIESHDFAQEKAPKGWNENQIMAVLRKMSRDNARTPMQWSSKEQAGFTKGQPWLKINPNYFEINADKALNDPNSIFYTYQRLIELRHSQDWLMTADFELLESENEIFAYLRRTQTQTFLIVANLSNQETIFVSDFVKKQMIIQSVSPLTDLSILTAIKLQAWDAFAVEVTVRKRCKQ